MPQPRGETPKQAAIDLDDIADRSLSDISAADFLAALERAQGAREPVSPENATVRDALEGRVGGLPEKKKVEREKQPLEKLLPEKSFEKSHEGFPEKKKVELEKQMLEKTPVEKSHEGFPEKKKVELEKQMLEKHVFEKQPEKQSIENPPEIMAAGRSLTDRLASIEAKLAGL